ncbi:hypothetical protein AAMO2058_000036300 [Amorphochlora amoebiformis]
MSGYATYERMSDDKYGAGKSRSSLYDADESSRTATLVNGCFVFSWFLIVVGVWQVIRARNLQKLTTRDHCTIIDREDKSCFYECACDADNACLHCPGVASTYIVLTTKCGEREMRSENPICLPRPQFRIGDVVQCFVPPCEVGTIYLGSPNQDYFAAVLCLCIGGMLSCAALTFKFFKPAVSV